MQYNREQILQLAPDDASAKAGRQLATPGKWMVRAANELAIWGECQGSGRNPYQTAIDLTNIAFKCNCPSRKFPCKHGLGLFLLYAEDQGTFHVTQEMPAYVSEWLSKRQARETTQETKEEKPVDETARAKRVESREKKVAGGMEELRAWLSDVIRAGIAQVPQQAYQFHNNITARMVDAQAGGLAGQLRQINQINFFNEGWQKQLLKRLSALYIISEGYTNRDSLPAATARDIATLIGWTIPKEEVLQTEPVTDHWIVLSVTMSDEGNVTTERIWLYGLGSSRFALLLNFYAGNQPYQTMLVPGIQIDADIVYYPASVPMRAMIRQQRPVTGHPGQIDIPDSFSTIYKNISGTLSQNPFTEQIPFMIEGIRATFANDRWFVTDLEGLSVPIANPEDECWNMLAFSGGRRFSAFGVCEQGQFDLHFISANRQGIFLKS
ncbi:SWIM zinc finger domain-containing protein [Dyadobacter sp. SG02]|uniref:SWIM zinc finger family protein n=1 Tax=Dyadobacter sp. SG02 TaxID=1855291 RepID=UPI00115F95B1|nr:SWIM zinc finger family protein [Dyadobacter sp. SG02]